MARTSPGLRPPSPTRGGIGLPVWPSGAIAGAASGFWLPSLLGEGPGERATVIHHRCGHPPPNVENLFYVRVWLRVIG